MLQTQELRVTRRLVCDTQKRPKTRKRDPKRAKETQNAQKETPHAKRVTRDAAGSKRELAPTETRCSLLGTAVTDRRPTIITAREHILIKPTYYSRKRDRLIVVETCSTDISLSQKR